MGIEPTTSAWKAEVLPLNYTRVFCERPLTRYDSTNYHASSSSSFLYEARCVEATRSIFTEELLVAEVLPLNYIRNLSIFTLEAAPGFEPGVKVLQTSALPLGYAATHKAEDGTRTRDPHLGKVVFYH